MVSLTNHRLADRRSTALIVLLAVWCALLFGAPTARASDSQHPSRFDFWELPLEVVLEIVVSPHPAQGELDVAVGTAIPERSLARSISKAIGSSIVQAAVYVDGQRILDPDIEGWLDDFPIEWLARIEIVQGNGALLWGEEGTDTLLLLSTKQHVDEILNEDEEL